MSDYQITEAMINFGGSFVSALGRLWRMGDVDNQRRLKSAFPEYWLQYHDIAVLAARKAGTIA